MTAASCSDCFGRGCVPPGVLCSLVCVITALAAIRISTMKTDKCKTAWRLHDRRGSSLEPDRCRRLGGVEVQQNLLVRLQNLCQLEGLLAHTLALLPNPPGLHILPNNSPPALHKKAQVSFKARVRGSTAVRCPVYILACSQCLCEELDINFGEGTSTACRVLQLSGDHLLWFLRHA